MLSDHKKGKILNITISKLVLLMDLDEECLRQSVIKHTLQVQVVEFTKAFQQNDKAYAERNMP